MDQLTISQLGRDARFAGFLLVRSCDQRTDSKGKLYLDMNLVDRTGEINCKMWNLTPNAMIPSAGCVAWVQGTVQEFNGRMQLRIDAIRPRTPQDDVDLTRLVPCAPERPTVMLKTIEDTIDSFESEELKKVVREMLRLAGDDLMWFPAAQRMHHAERSGLLHHTTDMLRTAECIIASYPFLHGDLLRAGVIVHDLAKIQEMKSDQLGNVSDYSRDGLLIGHLVRGVVRLEQAAQNVGVTGETVALLEHMIISHHGIPEYGSPRMPMFPEAEALHWIDTLDARMNEMQGIQDRTPKGAFSERIFSLDNRRMYHPYYTDDAE